MLTLRKNRAGIIMLFDNNQQVGRVVFWARHISNLTFDCRISTFKDHEHADYPTTVNSKESFIAVARDCMRDFFKEENIADPDDVLGWRYDLMIRQSKYH